MIGLLTRVKRRAFGRPALLSRDRRAATAVEYGLILALIVIAMVASLGVVANTTVGLWNNVNSKVGAATGH